MKNIFRAALYRLEIKTIYRDVIMYVEERFTYIYINCTVLLINIPGVVYCSEEGLSIF